MRFLAETFGSSLLMDAGGILADIFVANKLAIVIALLVKATFMGQFCPWIDCYWLRWGQQRRMEMVSRDNDHPNSNHNHSASPDQLEAKLLRDKMKKRILAETTPITKIYDEKIVKTKLSKVAAILPAVIEYRSNMSKVCRKIKRYIRYS
ncbi:unnamed protein product [Rotaria socialis]